MKNFLRRIFFAGFAFFAAANVFSYGGIMAGDNGSKMQVAKTEYFDILFTESTKDDAAILYANADKIYVELAEMYGWEYIPCRVPVVLTANVELYNAYYSTFPYSHIVMYVTSPSEGLYVNTDSFLDCFRHELTHNFTYNMKNGFWRVVDSIFGEYLSFASVTVSPGMAEGATMTSESANGYGRMNDEFSHQMVRQAKIENSFPDFKDVQGASDFGRTGDYYYFNGAFHKYLQEKYGMEKYAAWWYSCVNSSLLIGGAFNRNYGLSISDAWENFKKEYYVPEVEANPVAAGLTKDFFDRETKTFSRKNKSSARFDTLSLSKKGLTFLDASSNLYFVKSSELLKNQPKVEKLFYLKNMEKASQSSDGKYIAVSYWDTSSANYRSCVSVYNTENKKWLRVDGHGLKDGQIVKNENDYYLVCLKVKGQNQKISIRKISDFAFENEKEISFTRNQLPFSFVESGNGNFSFILMENMGFSICSANVRGEVLSSYKCPYSIRGLSYDSQNEIFYFAYTKKNSMPRLASFSVKDKTFAFSDDDFSGGLWQPYAFDSYVIYSGHFYKEDRIFIKDLTTFSFAEKSLAEEKKLFEKSGRDEEDEKWIRDFASVEKKDFNRFNYLKGFIFPISTLQSYTYDSDHANASTYTMPLGLTYAASNPWGSNQLLISAGYGRTIEAAGLSVTYSGSCDTGLYSYTLSGQSEFDKNGFKASDASAKVQVAKSFGKKSAFVFAPSVLGHYGRSNSGFDEISDRWPGLKNLPKNYGISLNQSNYFYGQASCMLYFSNIHKTSNARLSKSGILFGLSPIFAYSYNVTDRKEDYSDFDISLFFEGKISRLLPFECPTGFTYNLPSRVVFQAFSTSCLSSNFVGYTVPSLAYLYAETILFAAEIQRVCPYFSFIYVNDVRVALAGYYGYNYVDSSRTGNVIADFPSYLSDIVNGKSLPQAKIELKATFGFNPMNFGSATSLKYNFALAAELNYNGQVWDDDYSCYFDLAF